MNIQLLLSGAQSQGASSVTKQTLSNTLESPQGVFRQALSQAANAPSRSSQAHSTSSDSAAAIAAQPLQALGFEFSEQSLSSLLSGESYSVEGEALTPLDEIAARMDLVALFADAPAADTQLETIPTLETLMQQLNMGEDQVAELLSELGIRHQADQALGLAESLTSLTEEQAGQLISALSVLLASPQNSGGALPLSGDSPRQASVLPVQLLNGQGAPSQESSSSLHRSPAASISQVNALPVSSQDFLAQLGTLTPSAQADSRTMLSALDDGESALRASQIATALSGHTALGNSPIAAPGTSTVHASMGTPINSPAWPSQLGQQLVQFAQRGGEQQVQMQLHPAELGPLSITLRVSEQGTQAHFLSSHMQVRQVIEQAIPQLREALAEQGISLGETSVGEQHNSNEQAFAQKGNAAGPNGGDSVSGTESGSVTPAVENHSVTLDGRVDLYA